METNLSKFGIETERFDKFDKAFDFLTELYKQEEMESSESIQRAIHINAAREALCNELRESVAKLRKIKEEEEAAMDAHYDDAIDGIRSELPF